jgi:hypothetical protein
LRILINELSNWMQSVLTPSNYLKLL